MAVGGTVGGSVGGIAVLRVGVKLEIGESDLASPFSITIGSGIVAGSGVSEDSGGCDDDWMVMVEASSTRRERMRTVSLKYILLAPDAKCCQVSRPH